MSCGCCPCLRRPRRDISVLIVGLDGAGKSTILRSCAKEAVTSYGAAVSYQSGVVKQGKYNIAFFDMAGTARLRTLWQNLYPKVHAFMFVVDSCGVQRMSEAKTCLDSLLAHSKAKGKPLLVLANKQDKDDPLDEIAIFNALGLESYRSKQALQCQVECCSATTGDKKNADTGIWSGIRWLCQAVDGQYGQLSARVQLESAQQDAEEEKLRRERLGRAHAQRMAREQIAKVERGREAKEMIENAQREGRRISQGQLARAGSSDQIQVPRGGARQQSRSISVDRGSSPRKSSATQQAWTVQAIDTDQPLSVDQLKDALRKGSSAARPESGAPSTETDVLESGQAGQKLEHQTSLQTSSAELLRKDSHVEQTVPSSTREPRSDLLLHQGDQEPNIQIQDLEQRDSAGTSGDVASSSPGLQTRFPLSLAPATEAIKPQAPPPSISFKRKKNNKQAIEPIMEASSLSVQPKPNLSLFSTRSESVDSALDTDTLPLLADSSKNDIYGNGNILSPVLMSIAERTVTTGPMPNAAEVPSHGGDPAAAKGRIRLEPIKKGKRKPNPQRQL